MSSKRPAREIALEAAMQGPAFAGFAAEDFAVFEVPGFEARMPRLREIVKPKLIQIAGLLPARIAKMGDYPACPHVAQHLRRTVNAPEETWVAFSPSPKAYKPFVHYRVAVSRDRVRVTVFVEDYADEKLRFAASLAANADELSRYLEMHPEIAAFQIPDEEGQPSRGAALTPDRLREFAERVRRVKGQHAVFGIVYPRRHASLRSGAACTNAVLKSMRLLKPFYDCRLESYQFESSQRVATKSK